MKEGKFFLDTNILVYSFDDKHILKQKCAMQLIEHSLETNRGVISFQVVQEFLNVCSKKFLTPMSAQEQKVFLQKILIPLCEIYPDNTLYEMAIDLYERYHFSFYDALIVAGALEARCKILYTEDLQHGQNILDLKIIDPFRH
jgi:predicted nucleic acid-binding protein